VSNFGPQHFEALLVAGAEHDRRVADATEKGLPICRTCAKVVGSPAELVEEKDLEALVGPACFSCRTVHRIAKLDETDRLGAGQRAFEAAAERAAKSRWHEEQRIAWARAPAFSNPAGVVACSCGRTYFAGSYKDLPAPANGSQQPTFDDDGRPFVLELRNCVACGSTMAREVVNGVAVDPLEKR